MPKSKKRNKKNFEKINTNKFFLPEKTKSWIGGVIVIVLALIVFLSFFGNSGVAGHYIKTSLFFLIGNTVFILPLILLISGLVFFSTRYRKFFPSLILAIFILILGISGTLENLNPGEKIGGWIGYFFTFPFLKLFDFWVTQIIFTAIIIIGSLIFWHLLRLSRETKLKGEKEEKEEKILEDSSKNSFIKKIFSPNFKVKEVPLALPEISKAEKNISSLEIKNKVVPEKPSFLLDYKLPPADLLEEEKGSPSAGDIRINAAIIKKTLQNFDIPVEMSEINIGPTVTQYTLKPSEGVKLSKITSLNNDLALALASHPIRVEAPIPGKSLVGIEVPNKVRAQVRLRELVEREEFQKNSSPLMIVLGRDVSGNPTYADLTRMPHLLVAGSTGSGKTIFLNNFILSLLYRNSPEILRLILIDPKRVEFPAYNDLPHLLAPVIYDAPRAVLALKWLTSEMERRFDVLAASRNRDIIGYNANVGVKEGFLPYIVLIVDELADLMAAKGKEIEAGIVRLAQMARAVGIHLMVATQRPSVEVITGLIKANITSRITFQVASQVDSRTVLDTAGGEKLLGLGDLLYLSAELGKPKRVQSPYISDKELKKVVNFIKTQSLRMKTEKMEGEGEFSLTSNLAQELEKGLEENEENNDRVKDFYNEDPLYQEAKKVVIQAKKASASLLQRRLKIGYARAARLIDMLEEEKVVGPADGAKPREVYLSNDVESNNDESEEWNKV